MRFSFSRIFESLLKEVAVKNIGIFPGKFKPPHRGHFKTCEVASKENDVVLVLISNKEHEGYTPEHSFNIWNIYKKYLPNIVPFITTPTPVLGTYDVAALLNSGDVESFQVKTNVKELIQNSRVIESYLNVGNSIKLNLYSSPEDQDRYSRILKSPFMGKNVLDISFKPVDRLTSATQFRDAIKHKKDLTSFLPEVLSKDDKLNIIKLLQ